MSKTDNPKDEQLIRLADENDFLYFIIGGKWVGPPNEIFPLLRHEDLNKLEANLGLNSSDERVAGGRLERIREIWFQCIEKGLESKLFGTLLDIKQFSDLPLDIEQFSDLPNELWDKKRREHNKRVENAIAQINIRFLYPYKRQLVKRQDSFFIEKFDEKQVVSVQTLQNINSGIVKEKYQQALSELEQGNYSTVITLARNILEETLLFLVSQKVTVTLIDEKKRHCFCTTDKNGKTRDLENAGDLFGQFKKLYDINEVNQEFDEKRGMLTALGKVVSGIVNLRNKLGIDHPHGEKQNYMEKPLAFLCLNSAFTVANYCLEVAECQDKK